MSKVITAQGQSVREDSVPVAAPRWIPRVVRCRSCGALAREAARQRVSDEEVVVRFECDYCCQPQKRHYFETHLS